MSDLYDDFNAAENDMVRMYRDGYSIREIAKEYCRTPAMVYKIFKRRYIEIRNKSEARRNYFKKIDELKKRLRKWDLYY